MKINNVLFAPENTLTKHTKTPQMDFGDMLKESINNVNNLQLESSKQGDLLAMGQVESIHGMMIASQKAEIALQFTIEVKNKIIDAYREIMRLQL